MRQKTILSPWPVRIRDIIRALQVYDITPIGNSAEGTEESHSVVPIILTDCYFVSSGIFHKVIELLSENFKLNENVIVLLEFSSSCLKNHDDKAFIISH